MESRLELLVGELTVEEKCLREIFEFVDLVLALPALGGKATGTQGSCSSAMTSSVACPPSNLSQAGRWPLGTDSLVVVKELRNGLASVVTTTSRRRPMDCSCEAWDAAAPQRGSGSQSLRKHS